MEMRMTDAMRHHVRSLSFPEDSRMGLRKFSIKMLYRCSELFFALAIPLDDPSSTMSMAMFLEAEYELPNVTEIEWMSGNDEGRVKRNTNRQQRRVIDRTTIYAMLESKFESSIIQWGIQDVNVFLDPYARPNDESFHIHNGLLGDLLRIVFTQARPLPEQDLLQEYIDAENVKETEECMGIYSSCEFNIYDFVTFREA
ncbi:hypothetical protein ACFW04_008055 [Cataglyphis niger]